MFFIDTLETAGLGNRGYLAGTPSGPALVVDPPRDIDRVIAAAARRGVRITHVAETHVHNDYVTGGLELARVTGARYLVPADARVAYDRIPVADGDTFLLPDAEIGAGAPAGDVAGHGDGNGPGRGDGNRDENEDEDRGGNGGADGFGGASARAGGGLEVRALATPGHTPHHTSYVLWHAGAPVAAFTGGSLLIGTVGRPDLVEPRLTEQLTRAQHASAHRLAELPASVQVLPTHGFGSFCASGQRSGTTDTDGTTIGTERRTNDALLQDVDTFTAELLARLDDVPAYYAHMGPLNAAGPAPVDLTPPVPAGPADLAARLAAGEWVVDLRHRVAFAEGHLAGTYNFELDGSLATYLAWLVPWGKPVTLLAETPERLADAQRELVRVGIDRPAAAATGAPADWAETPADLRHYSRADFTALATARADTQTDARTDARAKAPAAGGSSDDHGLTVLDVRRASERATAAIAGSLHIPIHELPQRLDEVPAGPPVWVHCASGTRAAIAASFLDAVGHTVIAIDDTFDAAEQAGLPIRTPEANQADADTDAATDTVTAPTGSSRSKNGRGTENENEHELGNARGDGHGPGDGDGNGNRDGNGNGNEHGRGNERSA